MKGCVRGCVLASVLVFLGAAQTQAQGNTTQAASSSTVQTEQAQNASNNTASENCAESCLGQTCDTLINYYAGTTCESLEADYSCSCEGCGCYDTHDKCPVSCFGVDCDDFVALGYDCSELESVYQCDCTGCACTSVEQAAPCTSSQQCPTGHYCAQLTSLVNSTETLLGCLPCTDDDGRTCTSLGLAVDSCDTCQGCAVTNQSWIADGFCDVEGGYNTENCNWDGGDCCSTTCTDADYQCGENTRFACLNPNASDFGDQCEKTCTVGTETHTCSNWAAYHIEYDCRYLEQNFGCDCHGCACNTEATNCSSTCFGWNCDDWVDIGFTCDYMEEYDGCDCSGCQCTEMQGTGTQLSCNKSIDCPMGTYCGNFSTQFGVDANFCSACTDQEDNSCDSLGRSVDGCATCAGCSVEKPADIGDGYCDVSGGYNTATCSWDGGDCCASTCNISSLFGCKYNYAYDCRDPSAEEFGGCENKCVIGNESHHCDVWANYHIGYDCETLENSYGCDCTGCACVAQETECPSSCYSLNCDDWVNIGFTCSYMEIYDECDCSGCDCTGEEGTGSAKACTSSNDCDSGFFCANFSANSDSLLSCAPCTDQEGNTCSSLMNSVDGCNTCEGCSVVKESFLGDGYCDKTEGYNTAACSWDRGDCCESTCKDGDWTCGAYEYDCTDPSASDYSGNCQADCFGETCDYWVASQDYSCFALENVYGCDCSECLSCQCPTCGEYSCAYWIHSKGYSCTELSDDYGCDCGGCYECETPPPCTSTCYGYHCSDMLLEGINCLDILDTFGCNCDICSGCTAATMSTATTTASGTITPGLTTNSSGLDAALAVNTPAIIGGVVGGVVVVVVIVIIVVLVNSGRRKARSISYAHSGSHHSRTTVEGLIQNDTRLIDTDDVTSGYQGVTL